jgi:tetratricopeptide (TPR) repeat protein
MTEFQNAYERGCLLFEQRRYDLAIKEFRAALVSEPNSPAAHAMLALSLSADGYLNAGIEEAEEAVRLGPDLAYAHYVLSRVLSAIMNFETPKAALDFPIEIDRIVPNWASVRAIRAAEEALRLDATDPDHFARLAYLKVWSWHWTEGLELAERGLALEPTEPGCIHARLLALTGLGRQADANAALKQFTEHHPNHPLVHELTGRFKAHENQLAAAQEHLIESLRINPNSVKTQRALGRARNIETLRGRNWLPTAHSGVLPQLESTPHRRFPKWIKPAIVLAILLTTVLLLLKLQLVSIFLWR